MTAKRILNVGQCLADRWSMSRMIRKHFDAEVACAHSTSEALDQLRQDRFDLVLVNRILDADGSSGLDLVREIKADDSLRQVPVMLVSNYEEPQRQAIELGAVPGFGKAALSEQETIKRLRAYLELK